MPCVWLCSGSGSGSASGYACANIEVVDRVELLLNAPHLAISLSALQLILEPVYPTGCAKKQRVFFFQGEILGDFFERIPEHVIRAALPIDRKVTLEHAALWSKLFSGPQMIGTGFFHQLI
jgi:hypothetical protein